jgi:toxin ParE1/3/4
MQVRLNARAQREAVKIADRYDGDRPGLGDEFLAELNRVLDVIEAHGHRMAIIDRDVRAVRLNRFPYGVCYRIIPNFIRVFTIRHLHRRPEP